MSSHETWDAVDAYITETLALRDPALDTTLKASAAAGLPPIAVSEPQGRMLQLLAAVQGARSILEIGTLGGYSTICLARALPEDGRLTTLEYDPAHAEVARGNIAAAGLADRVEVRVGAALETLPQVQADGLGPFDLVFIDADKVNNPSYVRWALELSRPGTLIIVDNVVRNGKVSDASSQDPAILGTRAALEFIAAEPRLVGTAVQTVGSKGYDGFALARVVG
ncbi:O-methyltransferase [Streptacidiphilus sp. PB12-B1b]|uniref:O-methyltransferase n=1 Tax=Streptacidiphilus sp. PB12-B1b TaxID=2705012 RepID=UPI0015FD577D|nr:O-methyltransferase [Streptacidiphilus sp. PB12-B1b]QMU76531.1 O-methyltransferase [Streptacidiphilus sp. PB12-B1b]